VSPSKITFVFVEPLSGIAIPSQKDDSP
jgi:hypothetical protein